MTAPGQAAYLRVVIEPPAIPAGFFVTTLVDVESSPDGAKPEIMPGFPRIRVICPVVGEYALRVRVNLVAKSSCGGVKARTLTTRKVRLLAR